MHPAGDDVVDGLAKEGLPRGQPGACEEGARELSN